jgi:hypothetical protein
VVWEYLMNNTEYKKIHIQLTGDPSKIPLEDLISIIKAYIDLLGSVNISLLKGKEFSYSEFSLININDCCTDIELAVDSEEQIEAHDLLYKSIKEGVAENLPYEVKQKHNNLSRKLQISKIPDLALTLFNESGIEVQYLSKTFDIEDIVIEEHHTIYGKMVNIGGKSPNFHLEDHKGFTFIIELPNQEGASNLANRLYSTIGVVATCKVHIPSMEVDSRCKFVKLLPYDDRNWSEDNSKLLDQMPILFSSTQEMNEKLLDIRHGKNHDS